MFRAGSAFLFLSGASALVYQVSWVRLLGLSMGATHAAVATILAAFFLGMALGSAAAGQLTRGRLSLRHYALLELVIALSAVAVLHALLHLDKLIALVEWSDWLGGPLAAKFLLTLALLLVPTAAMGATFPILAALLVRNSGQLGHGLSLLYSINTLGAVFGALAGAFWLIPSVGLDGAIHIAAATNLLVALLAWRWARRLPEVPAMPPSERAREPIPWRPYAVLAVTGFASIMTEVAWTKYLAIFTGTTIYGFAVILAAFLSGIAGGAWLMRRHLDRLSHPERWLAVGLLATAALLLLTRAGLGWLPPLSEGIHHMGVAGEARLAAKYLITFLLLVPPTLIFGALFPLALHLCCGDARGVRRRTGHAYSLNTLASIAGSLVAGFWLIPRLGSDTTLLIAALLVGGAGLLFVNRPGVAFNGILTGGASAILTLAILLPGLNYPRLIGAVDYYYDEDAYGGEDPQFLYLAEGKAAVISLVTHDGRYLKLQSNGLNESVLDREDPSHVPLAESLLAYLPYFIHPRPHTAFVIGFGGGVTTRAFTHTDVEEIRVVELEPEVIEADRRFPEGPVQALADPRVQLDIDDARHTLLTESRRYDLIASQPSHPWLAGAGNLFTLEFFRLVHDRLTEQGIFAQWVNLFRMDAGTLRSLFRSFNAAFPHTLSFAHLATGDLILLGSRAPLHLDPQRIRPRLSRPAIARALAHYQIHQPLDLFWYAALSRREMLEAAGSAPYARDSNLLTEVRLAALEDPPEGQNSPVTLLHQHFGFHLADYLPQQRTAELLHTIGRRFLAWDSPDVARKIIDHLEPLDVERARSLLHETLWWEHDWTTAQAWYARFPQWPDADHLRQLRIELAEGRLEQAEIIATRIRSPAQRQLARAMILYTQRDWPRLAELEPMDEQVARWHWIGLSHLDLETAGRHLAVLVDDSEAPQNEERPVLETLIRYYAAHHDPVQSDRWARHLVAHDDAYVERYRKLARAALDKGSHPYANELLHALEALRPDDPELARLRRRLGEATRLARHP